MRSEFIMWLIPVVIIWSTVCSIISFGHKSSRSSSLVNVNTINSCRDRRIWPFSNTSIWNMPIGSNASFVKANLFNTTLGYELPNNFFGDTDYFYTISKEDPLTPWYNQGHWGSPCSNSSYCPITGNLAGNIKFPLGIKITAFCENNAAALLQPDNITLLQMQPLYRCMNGTNINNVSPILAETWALSINESILGDGIYGAHGGSHLSSIGGTLRLGELIGNSTNLEDNSNIKHALKLELYAAQYYYRNPCYTWPATTCDGYHTTVYNGTNKYLVPGSLLAVPNELFDQLYSQMKTVAAMKVLFSLTYYGGYLCDDTFANRGTFCVENGVKQEFSNYYGYSFDAQSKDNNNPFYKDLLIIFQNLQIVTNNGENNVGGGGTPLQPLAPPIC